MDNPMSTFYAWIIADSAGANEVHGNILQLIGDRDFSWILKIWRAPGWELIDFEVLNKFLAFLVPRGMINFVNFLAAPGILRPRRSTEGQPEDLGLRAAWIAKTPWFIGDTRKMSLFNSFSGLAPNESCDRHFSMGDHYSENCRSK